MFHRGRSCRAALLATLVLLGGQAARAAGCACATCPMECEDAGRTDPEPPCCGDPDPAPACSCPHIDVSEGLPPTVDPAPTPSTILDALPEQDPAPDRVESGDVFFPGPAPPRPETAIYLRNLSLRL